MRGKRAKQYKKLMQQYGMSFGFREAYQVLRKLPNVAHQYYCSFSMTDFLSTVDADIIKDADRFKMDLVGGLERTLHGQVKPSMFICLHVLSH